MLLAWVWGLHDVLKDDGWPVVAFVAAKSARDSERFSNCRSEAGWLLREALESRRMALPDDPELIEELLALEWTLDPQGRTALGAKDAIKARLRRSPDRADALMILAHALDQMVPLDIAAFGEVNLGLSRVSPFRMTFDRF